MSMSSRIKRLEDVSGISGDGTFSFWFFANKDSNIAREKAIKDFVADGGNASDIGRFFAIKSFGKNAPKDYRGKPLPSYRFLCGVKGL